VLDGIVHDETNALQLSKLLATCFATRGSQLSIVRRLESQYVVQIHTDLLSWIAKRLATYENSKNKRSFKSAAAFFKVLVPLLGTIQSRDALKVYVIKLVMCHGFVADADCR
jgi:cohesin complex subunit SA-1/2